MMTFLKKKITAISHICRVARGFAGCAIKGQIALCECAIVFHFHSKTEKPCGTMWDLNLIPYMLARHRPGPC